MSNTFEFNHRRERGWNDQVLAPGPPPLSWRRAPSPDRDLQNLVINGKLPSVQSAKTLPTRTSIESRNPSAFDSIAATLGFRHHHGTDKSAELKVLKKIMKRETLLNVLVEACSPKKTNTIVLQNKKGSGVLDLMTQLRETTVDLIELLCYWRTTMIGHDPECPRPFLFEERNYLLKAVYDMDFLADIAPLVDGLGISAEKMVSNPLMMPESLDIEKLSTPPAEWARKDANDKEGQLFRDRLRLRKVEHILLQEMEFNSRGNPSVSAWGDSTVAESRLSQGQSDAFGANQSLERKAVLLDWYDEARSQMFKLEDAQSEQLNPAIISTHRLEVPAPVADEMEGVKYYYSPSKMVEPVKLIELTSDKVDEPFDDSRSPSPVRARTSSKVRKLKGLPSAESSVDDNETMAALCPDLSIAENDITLIVSIEYAPRSVALAGAAVLIVLAEGQAVPDDISWEAFRGAAIARPMAWDMNNLVPRTVPNYKVRAMTPFLTELDDVHLQDLQSDPLFSNESAARPTASKLIRWVTEILRIAKAPPPSKEIAQSHNSTVLVAIEKVKSRRSAATAARKKKAAMVKDVIADDMKVLFMEENVTDIREGATLKVQLLCPKKKPVTAALKRYVVRVVDMDTIAVTETPINSREMGHYASELRGYFPGIEIEKVFKPSSDTWWKTHLRSVLTVVMSGSDMVVRVSKRLIRVVVGKLIEEKGLEAAATSSSPDPGSTRATASGGDTSEAKWDFHTQEDDSEGERGSQTVSEPESKPAAMASKEEVAVEDKRIEMKEEAKEEGFLEVRKVSFQGLPYSGGSQIVFAELKIANMDTWNGSTDVIENVDSSFSWNTRLTGTVDLIRPEQRMLKLQARTLVGGKEKHLASADVSTAEIKAGLGQWVVVTGAMGNDNGEVCGEFSISARFRQASDNDVWEDAPATPRGHAAATHEEYDDDNYGESEFENDELGSTTKSKKTTTESEDDYANDFEGSISEKKSKVLPAAESAGDDEYGDDDYEDEYADDEFAEEEE